MRTVIAIILLVSAVSCGYIYKTEGGNGDAESNISTIKTQAKALFNSLANPYPYYSFITLFFLIMLLYFFKAL